MAKGPLSMHYHEAPIKAFGITRTTAYSIVHGGRLKVQVVCDRT